MTSGEQNIGHLEEEALKRKERLKRLKNLSNNENKDNNDSKANEKIVLPKYLSFYSFLFIDLISIFVTNLGLIFGHIFQAMRN